MPAELEPQVSSTLKRLKLRCDNVLCTTPRHEVLGEWEIFSIPAVVVYDVQGEVHQVFDGMVDYRSEVIPLIDKMLGAEAARGIPD